MKAIQAAMLNVDAQLHRVEAEVAMQFQKLFGRCPELIGFAIQDLAAVQELIDMSNDNDRPNEKTRLFVTDMGFSATVSWERLEEVCELIGTAISDVVSEQPEAFELLRGRTFARTLH